MIPHQHLIKRFTDNSNLFLDGSSPASFQAPGLSVMDSTESSPSHSIIMLDKEHTHNLNPTTSTQDPPQDGDNQQMSKDKNVKP